MIHYLNPAFVITMVLLTSPLLADTVMGEYEGLFHPDNQSTMRAAAKVISEGKDHYRIVIDAYDRTRQKGANIEISGKYAKGNCLLFGQAGGHDWKGRIRDSTLDVHGVFGQYFELEKIVSRSPRAGMKPPPEAIVLLPFKKEGVPDTSLWTNPKWRALDDGSIQIVPGTGSNKTKQEFDDIKFCHIEFKLPLEPEARGQNRANGGIFVCDAYEVQLLDSFGVLQTAGDCGALYNVARPEINACLPPETWQSVDIMFRAPRLDRDGKAKDHPQITVYLNSIRIYKNLEIPDPQDRERGPIRLADEGHAICFRNIWIVEGSP